MNNRAYKTRLLALTFAFFILLTPAASASADPLSPPPISQVAPTQSPPSPVVARVYFASTADLNQLAARLDIWEVNHSQGYLLALLSPDQSTALRQAGYRLEIDAAKTARLNQPNKPFPGQLSGIPGFPCYRTVEETFADLAQLAADHPNLAAWVDIGDSWEKVTSGGSDGYDLYTLVLTNQGLPGPKPKFFLMTAIHAREYATAELATRFAEELVAKYGTDPDVTWLLDQYEVHFSPQTNPDGRKIAENGTPWRKNTHTGCFISSQRGVDLNRNSSFKWGGEGSSPFSCDETYRGPSPASEPETQALQSYVASIFPDQRGPGDGDAAPVDTTGVFLTLHSYGEDVLFPWGWTKTPSPNNTQLETLGRKFGFFTGYKVCQSGEDGCLYQTAGDTDDWAYGELGVAAYTFELGTAFFQDCKYFENTLIPENMPALYYALKAARRPYQNPAGPETLDVSVSSNAVPVGTPLTLTALADDTRYASGERPGNEPTQNIANARYSLDASSWSAGTSTFPLDSSDGAYDEKTENLQATVDTSGWSLGRHTLFIESQDAAGNWGVPSAVFVTIGDQPHAVKLDPDDSNGQAEPGETLDYTLQLTNLGTQSDTFDLFIGGNAWTTNLQPNPAGPLEGGSSTNLTVSVTVPESAVAGLSDTAILTAVSRGDSSKTATATVTTTAVEPYAFELTPDQAEESGHPGTTLTFTLHLHNTGTLADSYQFVLGDHTWEATVIPPELPLQPGVSADMVVTVTIPPEAIDGDNQTLLLTVSSEGDPRKSASASLKATALSPNLFTPFVLKQ